MVDNQQVLLNTWGGPWNEHKHWLKFGDKTLVRQGRKDVEAS